MNPLNLTQVQDYVNENIQYFHQQRLKSLETLKLGRLLRKNPYYFGLKI